MTKQCTKCLLEKSLESFSKRGTGRHSWCKQCKREYENQHYKDNESRRRSIRTHNNARDVERRITLNTIKSDSGCVDCGERDPIVLDFDHVVIGKVDNIANMVRRTSWEKILQEIDKCEVVCSNCHRRRTHARRASEAY